MIGPTFYNPYLSNYVDWKAALMICEDEFDAHIDADMGEDEDENEDDEQDLEEDDEEEEVAEGRVLRPRRSKEENSDEEVETVACGRSNVNTPP